MNYEIIHLNLVPHPKGQNPCLTIKPEVSVNCTVAINWAQLNSQENFVMSAPNRSLWTVVTSQRKLITFRSAILGKLRTGETATSLCLYDAMSSLQVRFGLLSMKTKTERGLNVGRWTLKQVLSKDTTMFSEQQISYFTRKNGKFF